MLSSVSVKIGKALERSSIKNVLAFAVTLFVLIPCCIFLIFLFNNMYDITTQEFISSQQKILLQTTYIIEDTINTMNSSSANMYLSSNLKDDVSIAVNNTNIAKNYRATERIRYYLKGVSSTLYSIDGRVAIVTLDGTVIDDGNVAKLGKNLSEYAWYDKVVKNEGFPYWDREISVIFNALGMHTSGITCARMLYSQSSKPLGIIVIMVPDTSFWAKPKAIDLSYRGNMYVIAHGGNLIATDPNISGSVNNITNPGKTSLFSYDSPPSTQIIDIDNDNKLFVLPIGKTDFYLYNEISVKVMLSKLTNNIKKMIVLITLVFLIFILVMIFISYRISRPIIRLTATINRVAQGDLAQRAPVYGYKEVYRLSDSFNRMTEKMVQLIKDVQTQTTLREEAHFDMLRAQINPHFLFNTLNSIKWISVINGVESISDAISELGKILNSTLKRNDKMITLDEELDILNAYINIQKLRYGNIFEYRNLIPDELKGYYVPKFILQPIIENSIFHGFSETNDGLITASGKLEGGELHIVIEDNGKGVPKDILDKLLITEKQSNDYMTGIGIKNIHERLKLQFGPMYGLTIDSGKSGGFSVTIKLPAMLKQDLKEGI